MIKQRLKDFEYNYNSNNHLKKEFDNADKLKEKSDIVFEGKISTQCKGCFIFPIANNRKK